MSHPLRDHIERIVSLTEGEFDHLMAHVTPRTFRRRQFPVQAGDAVPNDFFVLRGLLKSSYTDDNGREHILQFALEDWWITDYQAHFHETPATLDVECLEPVEVLALSFGNREKLCREIPAIEHFFRKKVSSGYAALQQRILSLLTSNARERHDQLLARHPELFQRVPKTQIAAYLGVSRETLSRLGQAAEP